MEDPFVCIGDGPFCVPVEGCEDEWRGDDGQVCWAVANCDEWFGEAPACAFWTCENTGWGGNHCRLNITCEVGQGCLPDGTCVDRPGG
jgi:hypothetical protein